MMIGMDKISQSIGLNQMDVLMLIHDGRLEGVTKNEDFVWVASWFKMLLWRFKNRALIDEINDGNAPNLQRAAFRARIRRLAQRRKGQHKWGCTQ
jgi:hypothetical protein